jgi:glycerol-3-phosphate O-acyltransferase
MLSKSVQISYAVGEWARVWPLEGLFKSFGSYFVRRGEKDALYHRTLQSYIELITKQGVTQAMFPEGGLSRDGTLRPAKLGLLDSMALAKRDPTFTRPLVFLPVGINFDRVLEDEVLVRETVAGDHPLRRRSAGQKLRRIGSLVGRLLWGIPVNVGRFVSKRLKKHGVCAIHFGQPLALDEWLAGPGQAFLAEQDRHRRHALLRPIGEDIMQRIAASIPVTPATATALAMRDLGRARMETGVEEGVLLAALRATLATLEAAGAPFFTGDPYERGRAERRLLADRDGRHELDEIHAGLGEQEDLERILGRALDVMQRRGLLVRADGVLLTRPGRWELVEYYANSLHGHRRASPAGAAGASASPGTAPLAQPPVRPPEPPQAPPKPSQGTERLAEGPRTVSTPF